MQLSETIKNIPQLLSVEEAAAYLRMSVSWVNQTLRKFCPARKIGRRVRYLKDDLDRFIERSVTFQTETHMNKSLVAIEARDGKTLPHK
jgi:excisionase family DNA binding protein